MTQLQGAIVVLPDNQAIAQLELEQYIEEQAGAIAPFAITYSFDYNQFKTPELQSKVRTTLGNFLGFVRQTFDGLLESDRALQHIYYDYIAVGTDGKKIFEAWLDWLESSRLSSSKWNFTYRDKRYCGFCVRFGCFTTYFLTTNHILEFRLTKYS
ncbi:hypothetical protein [uncultured Nostoc sp.]|uniref:hypothetical protein n=1 Tax=uncultured Nostoc sp. TaxID=340711 RepID=UPI0035CB8043